MKVAVLGGGPAGAFAAERLASAGARTILFDEKLAWEKPCGGGLTYKAWTQYPFLADNPAPKRVIRETVLEADGAKPATLHLDHPILIYSRFDLNGLLLARAERAGARLEKTRVTSIERGDSGWTLHTKGGADTADFCVVATGARNPLRNAGTQLSPGDTMSALGYYIPGERERIELQFFHDLDGYIWVFPRAGHLSVGIGAKGAPASVLRKRLEDWMTERGIRRDGAAFYSHLLPSLEAPAWKNNRLAGDGWLAAGDAAGLVDPITGEGIYYAIRSGDLAAEALIANPGDPATAYRNLLAREIAPDLEFGSTIAHRVFNGDFLGSRITTRMVQFTRRSARFRAVMQDLFDGTQPYTGLKKRLMAGFPQSVAEIGLSFLAGA